MDIVIVDDEFSAREILENLIKRFHPKHSIVGIYENLPAAALGIKKTKPDLVFLDIEMPEYAGFEIVNFFPVINFNIVFTTAYSNYALKAFEINAVDYLLKPIEIARLAQAILKVESIIEAAANRDQLAELKEQLSEPEINISYLEKGFKEIISTSNVIALEAKGAYTIIHTKTSKTILISKNLKQFENELEGLKEFIRIHRSWIINRKEIVKYSKTKLEIHLSNKLVAKISKSLTTSFEQLI